jgi:hypothetical protein
MSQLTSDVSIEICTVEKKSKNHENLQTCGKRVSVKEENLGGLGLDE